MKILHAIKTGFSRTLKAWKGIMIFWFILFLTVSLLVVPLNASFKSGLGNSMITEKLVKGINIDVLGDLGTNLHSMLSSLSSGIMMLSVVAVLLNIFITGGLFDSIRKDSVKFSSDNFFRASAKNFWSYLQITFIHYFIIIALIIIIVIIPVSEAAGSESTPEGMAFRIFVISGTVFIMAMSIVFLAADYSRAWQACQTHHAGFKALKFGFSHTFRTFLSSFPLMFFMLAYR
jgi:hypothetical protein